MLTQQILTIQSQPQEMNRLRNDCALVCETCGK